MLARGAVRLVGPAVAAFALVLTLIGFRWWAVGPASLAVAVVLAALATFLLVFFRDPDRLPGAGIVSAADGRVRAVDRVGDAWRISVFMNVTNVHVNRLPLDGRGRIDRGERVGVPCRLPSGRGAQRPAPLPV